jgi:hypothetical protein
MMFGVANIIIIIIIMQTSSETKRNKGGVGPMALML